MLVLIDDFKYINTDQIVSMTIEQGNSNPDEWFLTITTADHEKHIVIAPHKTIIDLATEIVRASDTKGLITEAAKTVADVVRNAQIGIETELNRMTDTLETMAEEQTKINMTLQDTK